MNLKVTTKEIVLSGLLLATGILLPMVFHLAGMSGPIFLPMHIPVLIGGMLLSPALALIVGALTPLISSALTGMPVLFPMAPIMVVELATYGLIASLCMRKLKLNIILSLVVSMVAGRIMAGVVVAILIQLFDVQMNPFIYVQGAIITGLPGLIIQIIFIPTLIYLIKRHASNLIDVN